jgi:hypothetical protein
MFIFKTRADLAQLPPWHPALPIVTDLLNRICTDCGYLVLVEDGDDFIDLPELRGRLSEISIGMVPFGSGLFPCRASDQQRIRHRFPDPGFAVPLRSQLEALL